MRMHCVKCMVQNGGKGDIFSATIISDGNSLCWDHYCKERKNKQ